MKFLGFGLGLRSPHYQNVHAGKVRVDWFEALTENYFGLEGVGAGPPLKNLLKVREKFPIVMHGVSLSIGSNGKLNKTYLSKLKQLTEIVQPEWVSDHFCWTGVHGQNLHDLLPVPYTQKLVQELCDKLDELQNLLGRPFVLENASTYVEFISNEMPEWEFVAAVARKSGCHILLDLNNVFVSAHNHRFDPYRYIDALPANQIIQIHLAGPADKGHYFIDTHDTEVRSEVWKLYSYSLERIGPVSTMVEWDANIPEYEVLEDEVLKAKKLFLDWQGKNESLAQSTVRL